VNSVTSQDVFLINLGDTADHREHGDHLVGINQIVWDPPTQTLHVESDQLLDQHTEYALIVTNGLRDADGRAVEPSDAFRRFRQEVRGEYKHELLDAIHAARRIGVRESDIVTASVFTTESATAVLEKIRDQIHAGTPAPADFNLGPDGERTVFSLADVTDFTFHEQTMADPPDFTDMPQPEMNKLRVIPGAIGQIAFGKFLSPDYEVHPGEFIPPVATRTGSPAVQGVNELYFDLFLPSSPKPTNGWPVAIFGPGGTGNKDVTGPNVAASMAAQGIATIVINGVGNGFGPLGTLAAHLINGGTVTFPSGGRGIDQNRDHIIGPNEGFNATRPRMIVAGRDGRRQTVADFLQLARVIEVGMDVDGDGTPDLDPSRMYYCGWSEGGLNGSLFVAVENAGGTLTLTHGSRWKEGFDPQTLPGPGRSGGYASDGAADGRA
jgi:hypothetical protein